MIYILITNFLLFISFLILFILTILYLVTLYQLYGQIEKEHGDLWISLGKPRFFFLFYGNPFQGFIAKINFTKWFLKRSHDITNERTLALIKKGKLLFYSFLTGFLLLSALITGLVLFIISHHVEK